MMKRYLTSVLLILLPLCVHGQDFTYLKAFENHFIQRSTEDYVEYKYSSDVFMPQFRALIESDPTTFYYEFPGLKQRFQTESARNDNFRFFILQSWEDGACMDQCRYISHRDSTGNIVTRKFEDIEWKGLDSLGLESLHFIIDYHDLLLYDNDWFLIIGATDTWEYYDEVIVFGKMLFQNDTMVADVIYSQSQSTAWGVPTCFYNNGTLVIKSGIYEFNENEGFVLADSSIPYQEYLWESLNYNGPSYSNAVKDRNTKLGM